MQQITCCMVFLVVYRLPHHSQGYWCARKQLETLQSADKHYILIIMSMVWMKSG